MRGVFRRLRREELAATSIVVVLLMTVLLLCAALVVDIGAVQVRKAQLQDAADAAALALAQECLEHAASSPLGCAAAVTGSAAVTAEAIAGRNVADGDVAVGEITWTADTVGVALTSTQTDHFGRIVGIDQTALTARANARWEQQVVPLALAMAGCTFPDPGEEAVLQVSLAVPNVVGALLGDDCGILSSDNVLSSTTGTLGLVAGGWLTSGDSILGLTAGSCRYDPNLLTTLAATVSKVAPTWCADEVRSWNPSAENPQRVIVPVFDSGLEQLVADDVLGLESVDRYAVIDVTGYSFSGLVGLSTVPGSDATLCTSVDGVLGRWLQDALGGLAPLTLALLGGLSGVLGQVTGCQALHGTFVGFVDRAEAAQLLVGVQLVE